VLGANGAGKTSLLRAVQGLIPVAGGTIRFDDKTILGLSPPQRLRRRLALVPEGRQIVLQLTVHENLQMGAYSRADSDVVDDIEAIYERFPNLAARRNMRAGVLSGGEQQMLAIGRALMSRPKFLMLDEPSLGLAPLLVKTIFEKIAEINRQQGITILLVQQNANLALEISHFGYVLETGKITLQGDSAALRQNPLVRSAYLGG
jgi:branched-chain amino acid transport system ATP-binding protein